MTEILQILILEKNIIILIIIQSLPDYTYTDHDGFGMVGLQTNRRLVSVSSDPLSPGIAPGTRFRTTVISEAREANLFECDTVLTHLNENAPSTHPRIELADMVPTFSTSVEPAVNLNNSIRGYSPRCILI